MWPHLVRNSCILHFIATGPQHQVKDFQPLFICDFQSFTSEGENPQTENVSLLVINFSSFVSLTSWTKLPKQKFAISGTEFDMKLAAWKPINFNVIPEKNDSSHPNSYLA